MKPPRIDEATRRRVKENMETWRRMEERRQRKLAYLDLVAERATVEALVEWAAAHRPSSKPRRS